MRNPFGGTTPLETKRLGLSPERPSRIIKKSYSHMEYNRNKSNNKKMELHEYPIGKPIDAENTPRLGQTYWRIAGELSSLNVVHQLWGYSPMDDSIAVELHRAYRTKEDALYACRGGQLQEITE